MAQASYQLINLTADIVVEWPSSFGTGPTVYDINNVDPSANGFTITFPNATLVSAGYITKFNNISTFDFDILANDGVTSIATIAAGEVVEIYLNNSSTSNGTWNTTPSGGGTNAIVNYTAESSDNSITITNGVIVPTGGTTNFQLPTSLFNLNKVNTTGFLIVQSTAPLVWGTIKLVGGKNISVTNADGINNNPIISVNDSITVKTFSVGNITASGSEIGVNETNGSIDITTNGTGNLNLNTVSIDTIGNTTITGNLTVDGSFNNSLTPTAYCVFTDTLVSDGGNDIAIQSQINISSVTGSNGSYTINFTTLFKNTNYGVVFGLGSTGGELPFVSHVFYTLRETGKLVIAIVDASGELVNAVPNSITIMIIGGI